LKDAESISYCHGSMQLFKKDFDSLLLAGLKSMNSMKVTKDVHLMLLMNGSQEFQMKEQTLTLKRFLGTPFRLYLKKLFTEVKLIMNSIKRFLTLLLNTFSLPNHLKQALNFSEDPITLTLKN